MIGTINHSQCQFSTCHLLEYTPKPDHSTPSFYYIHPPFTFFVDSFSVTLLNFTDYVTILVSFSECCKTSRVMQQGSSWLPKCRGTLRIAQQCLFLTSGMSRNFVDYLTMDVKYLKAVKRRLHAIKRWSPDKIRVWQSALTTSELAVGFNCWWLIGLNGSMGSKQVLKVYLIKTTKT